MLKLTYTETGFHLERLAQSIEEWVQGRVVLSLRVGQSLLVAPSTASFLLPTDLPGLPLLEAGVRQEAIEAITLCDCDGEYTEVSLQGTWLAADGESEEGDFVAAMSDHTEFFLFKLWQEAQAELRSIVRNQF